MEVGTPDVSEPPSSSSTSTTFQVGMLFKFFNQWRSITSNRYAYPAGDYAFSIDLQDAYLHVPIVKHHHHFLHFVWHNVPYQWKLIPFGLAMAPRVFTFLMKPILFLCQCKGLHIVIYLDDILVLICSKRAGKRAHFYLSSLLVHLGLHINFPSLTFASLSPLLSWGYVGILSACQYLYLLIS